MGKWFSEEHKPERQRDHCDRPTLVAVRERVAEMSRDGVERDGQQVFLAILAEIDDKLASTRR